MLQPSLVESLILAYFNADLSTFLLSCLFAALVGMLLLGVDIELAWRYYRTAPKGDGIYKLLVAWVSVGVLCQTGLTVYVATLAIQNAENYEDVIVKDLRCSIALYLCTLTSSWSGAIIFFGYKAWIMRDRSKVALALMLVMYLGGLISGLYTCIRGIMLPIEEPLTLAALSSAGTDLQRWYDSLILDVKVWTAFTLSSDLSVCGLLMWSLIRAPTHFENTRGVIHVLLRIIMESMTPPFLGMMAFACMILTNQSFLGPLRIVGALPAPLYLHSVLHSLMSRRDIADRMASSSGGREGATFSSASASRPSRAGHRRRSSGGSTVKLTNDAIELDAVHVLTEIREEISPPVTDEWANDFQSKSNRLTTSKLGTAQSAESLAFELPTTHAKPSNFPAHIMPDLESSRVSLKASSMV